MLQNGIIGGDVTGLIQPPDGDYSINLTVAAVKTIART